MKITPEQVAAFERVSQDHNPLHTDPYYSRSTQFGRPVVYGMCTVLLGLAAWAKGRRFQLSALRGQFGKPLFEGDEYELRIAGSGKEVKIRYLKGAVVQSGFAFTWEERQAGPLDGLRAGHPVFRPLLQAKDPEVAAAVEHWQGRAFPYSMDVKCAAELLPRLGLQADQLPLHQFNALLGSSYFVGMELPGRQALYSTFDFKFDNSFGGGNGGGFQFDAVTVKRDARLGRVAIYGRGIGIRAFSLVAFQRPKPVRYDTDSIRAAAGQSELLAGRAVFISGATRGFGSVLARMLALQGATLMVNYRSNRDRAEALAADVRRWNSRITLHGGDVSRAEDCRNIGAEIRSGVGRIDVLISNAFPQIAARSFLEQDGAEFLRFVTESVAATVMLFRELLPLMSNGGVVMLVSTIYTQAPKPQFSHYLAAKAALEGLMRTLALEFPEQRFIIVRPPRMLTDQTNLAFDMAPPVSPVEVGCRLLAALNRPQEPGNLTEINLSAEN